MSRYIFAYSKDGVEWDAICPSMPDCKTAAKFEVMLDAVEDVDRQVKEAETLLRKKSKRVPKDMFPLGSKIRAIRP